jgi:3-methyl-2-oxobutanoate hydroxymethyltransferase
VTIQSLYERRLTGIPIAMLTAYDYPSALACSAHGVDITLVGDSLAQVCLGYDSTTQLTLQEMMHHTRAVARGTTTPFLVADMPFGSYHVSPEEAVRNAVRLVQEGCVEAVKMEGGEEVVETVAKLTRFGIPVMAHVGLMPQRHAALSGYKVQGKDAESAKRMLRSALALEAAGAFSIVLEAVPHQLGTYITSRLSIPTIGIGAGPGTSGQVRCVLHDVRVPSWPFDKVLVWDDIFGTWSGQKAKFVRRFADIHPARAKGVKAYIEAVRNKDFPHIDHESYRMDQDEWEKLLREEEQGLDSGRRAGES